MNPIYQLYELFCQQVKLNPGKIAITYGEKSITYLNLAYEVEMIANMLAEHGVAKNDYVIVYMTNSIEAVKSMLAVHKIGAVVMPLDISLPAARVQKAYDDSHAAVVLCNSEASSRSLDAKIIFVKPENVDSSMQLEISPLSKCSDKEIAFCIYTSGSEGRPKGVLLPHNTIYNQIQGKNNFLGFPRIVYYAKV